MNSKPSVLYIEDDRLSRKLMERLLKVRMELPNVVIFEDSEDFAAKIEALDPKPDIILLDIHVDPLDGFEMLATLRKTTWAQRTPIIALTASVMNEEVQKLATAGFNGCLAKPVDVASFPEMLDRILKGEPIWYILN
jgi:CheY-like chemotaxis protein